MTDDDEIHGEERLLDDPSAAPWLKAELRLAKGAEPSESSRALARAQLAHLFGPAQNPGDATGNSSPDPKGDPSLAAAPATRAAASRTPAGPLLGGALIMAVALGGVAWWATHDDASDDSSPTAGEPSRGSEGPPQHTPATSDHPSEAPDGDQPGTDAPTHLETAEQPQEELPPTVPTAPGATSRRRIPSVPADAPPATPGPEEELSLLLQARRQLSARPRAALTALGNHRAAYPQSAFAEEREALRIEALLNLGRHAEARRLAERFHRTHPRSAHGARLRQLIARAP